MRLSMTLAAYPITFTPYQDNSLIWTVTVIDPCTLGTTILNPIPGTFLSMSTSVLGGVVR